MGRGYLVVIYSARFLHDGGEDGGADEEAECAEYAEERGGGEGEIVFEHATVRHTAEVLEYGKAKSKEQWYSEKPRRKGGLT